MGGSQAGFRLLLVPVATLLAGCGSGEGSGGFLGSVTKRFDAQLDAWASAGRSGETAGAEEPRVAGPGIIDAPPVVDPGGGDPVVVDTDPAEPQPVVDIELDLPPGSEHAEQNPSAKTLAKIDELPPVEGGGKTLAAALFEPAGLQFPEGLSFTWPLPSAQPPGATLHVALLDESAGRWLATGEKAVVSADGKSATGKVYHFSIYSLTSNPPSTAEPPGFAGVKVEKAHGGFVTNTIELKPEGAASGTQFPVMDETLAYAWVPSPGRIGLHFPFEVTAPQGKKAYVVVDIRHRGKTEPVPGLVFERRPDIGVKGNGVVSLAGEAILGKVNVSSGRSPSFSDRVYDGLEVEERFGVGTWGGKIGPVGEIYLPFGHASERLKAEREKGTKERDLPHGPPANYTVCFAEDAPRGWHSLWLEVYAKDLWHCTGDDFESTSTQEVELEFEARFFEVRSDHGIAHACFAAAQGYLSPEEIAEKVPNWDVDAFKLRRLPNVVFKVKLRRNGWVFHEAKVISELEEAGESAFGEKWKFEGGKLDGKPRYEISGSATAEGPNARGEVEVKNYYGLQRKLTPEEERDRQRLNVFVYPIEHALGMQEKLSWRLRFPMEMDAEQPADVEAEVKLVQHDREITQPREGDVFKMRPNLFRRLSVTGIGYMPEGFGYEKEAFGRASEPYIMFHPNTEPKFGTSESRDAWMKLHPLEQEVWPGEDLGEPADLSGTYRFHTKMAFGIEKKPYVQFSFHFGWLHRYARFNARYLNLFKGIATYRPRSAIENNLEGAAQPAPAAPGKTPYKEDGFADWYVEYAPENSKAEKRFKELFDIAGVRGAEAADKVRKARILLDAATHEVGWFTDLLGGDVVTTSEAMKAHMLQSVRRLNSERIALYDLVGKDVEEARGVIKDMLAMFPEQEKRTRDAGTNRPELARWKGVWEDRLDLLEPRFYLSVGDQKRFDAAMGERDLKTLDAHVRVELAELHLQANQPAEALVELRQALRIDPRLQDARRRATAIEEALIRAVARKVDGELNKAKGHFYSYLKARGYDSRDKSGGAALGEWFLNSLTTGPAAIVSALAGRAEIKEQQLDSVQKRGVLLHLGLNGIVALVNRGVTLEEINKGLPSDAIRHHLRGIKTAAGHNYTDADYHGLATFIGEAVKLEEIQALMNESPEGFRLAMEDSMFDNLDLDMSEIILDRIEFFGDIGSSKNLFMLGLPMSIGSVGGKLVRGGNWVAGARAQKSLAALERAKAVGLEVRTGLDVVSGYIGWGRVMSALNGTTTGSWLYKAATAYKNISTRGGMVWKASWSTTKLLTQWAVAVSLLREAEELGGPYAMLAAEAVLTIYLLDPDLLYATMRRAQVPPERVKTILHRYSREIARYEKGMINLRGVRATKPGTGAGGTANVGGTNPPGASTPAAGGGGSRTGVVVRNTVDDGYLAELQKLLVIDKSAPAAERKLAAYADAHLGLEELFGHYVPSGDMLMNCEFAFYKAVLAVKRGSPEEARAFGIAAANLLVRAEEQLTGLLEKQARLDKLMATLDDLQVAGAKNLSIAGPRLDLAFRNISDIDDGSPVFKKMCSEGDMLRLAGDYEGAAKKYLAALSETDDPKLVQEVGAMLEFTRQVGVARAKYGTVPPWVAPVVNADDLDDAIAGIADSANLLGQKSQNWVYRVKVNGRTYFVKHIKRQLRNGETAGMDFLHDSTKAELVASELAELFGVRNAKTVMKRLKDADGNVVPDEWVLVSPMIDGKLASELPEAQLVAIKDQFAAHKVFSILLGDHDRKIDNYFVDSAGRLIGIDAGMGVLERGHGRDLGVEYVASHFLKTSHTHVNSATADPAHWLTRQFMLEQSMTSKDLAKAIGRAEELLGDPAQAQIVRDKIVGALRPLISDETQLGRAADEAMAAMSERLEKLKAFDFDKGSDFLGVPRNNLRPGSASIAPALDPEIPRLCGQGLGRRLARAA